MEEGRQDGGGRGTVADNPVTGKWLMASDLSVSCTGGVSRCR